MIDIRFDHFYRYEALSQLLKQYAEDYPHLVQLESIGSSHEGRTIWVVIVTHFATGPAEEKPAMWLDGNIHAVELTPSTLCLHHLNALVTRYGDDEDITRCLDTRVFYICPRVNPDGAEWALADTPRLIRSSTRPYPYDEAPIEGLIKEDIDGDGRILTMRLRDPNGAWKPHPDEPRLLIPRQPTEVGGEYYRLLPEGRLENYDGATIHTQPPRERLDLNRNFPVEWRPEVAQRGAGPFPTSEPEIRAVVEFVIGHPNIIAGVSFHTFGGLIMRPYSMQPDESMPAEDLWTYQTIGQKGTELTGYPNISVFHEFLYHPKEVITGAFDDWMYDHRGVFCWTVELWSPQRQAGITDYKYVDWFRDHPVEDDLKLLRWSDEKLDGSGYVDWYAFDHPQLGAVELGGWHTLHALSNPPPAWREQEIAPFPAWLVWHLLISPCLECYETTSRLIGPETYSVRLVVHNTGWLPTYVTKKALDQQMMRGVITEITLPDGATLAGGRLRQEHGQLEGRAYKRAASFAPDDSTTDRLKTEWIIHAPEGGQVHLVARHERAGVVRAVIALT